jgi:hypothetical protein
MRHANVVQNDVLGRLLQLRVKLRLHVHPRLLAVIRVIINK